jgi:hypothetical protein
MFRASPLAPTITTFLRPGDKPLFDSGGMGRKGTDLRRVELSCDSAEVADAGASKCREGGGNCGPDPLEFWVRIAPGISRAAHSLAVNSCLKRAEGEDISDQFQLIPTNLKRQRTLDRIDGNYELSFIALQKNAFQSIQASTSHPHPLASLDERVQGERYIFF